MSALVSIIIPFFNEEQYLHRALDSAVGQSYEHTEIILVNDGSTDKSLSIAESYQSKYPQIKLISTENRGLGYARNMGMTLTTGTYLTFLDSDDELNKEAVSTWIKKIKEEQADIVISKFNMVNLRMEHSNMLSGWKGEGQPGSGEDGISAMYEYRMSSTAWAKLYKSDLAKQLQFPEGLWFEDRPFLLSYFLLAKHIAYEESSQLNILSRQHSITRSLISERRIKDAYAIYSLELNIVAGHHNQKEYTRLIDRHQINAMVEALIILYYDKKGHPDVQTVKKCFSICAEAFANQLKENGTRIGLRDRADLLLIRLNKFIGWPLTFLILPLWKRKKCQAVFKLKSF
jgi:glycosyltransferase involved in cell wall biosynthesis